MNIIGNLGFVLKDNCQTYQHNNKVSRYNRYRRSELTNNSAFKSHVTCHELKKENLYHLFSFRLLKVISGIDETKKHGRLIYFSVAGAYTSYSFHLREPEILVLQQVIAH